MTKNDYVKLYLQAWRLRLLILHELDQAHQSLDSQRFIRIDNLIFKISERIQRRYNKAFSSSYAY